KSEQAPLWIPTTELPVSPGHPFYVRLNELLDAAGFDRFVEEQCRPFYAPVMGRPSLAPGRYFRLLLIGYFEGLDSERGIGWRAAGSWAVRHLLGLGLDEAAPDHSTISRTRRLIDVEAHQAVFTWVQERLVEAHLLRGQTLAVDATTLEANAAMRSIVRRDTGESYQQFLTRLAKASGLKTPSRAALARLDRRRKKRTSNAAGVNPSDPDATVEPERGRRCWRETPEAQGPVYGNRRRVGGARGRRLMRRRGEYVERTFAHVYDTGGLRRVHLRGHPNILKRLIVHAGAFNLGLLMRHTIGRGTPRGLQGRRRGCFALSLVVGWLVATLRTTLAPSFAGSRSLGRVGLPRFALAATGRPQ